MPMLLREEDVFVQMTLFCIWAGQGYVPCLQVPAIIRIGASFAFWFLAWKGQMLLLQVPVVIRQILVCTGVGTLIAMV